MKIALLSNSFSANGGVGKYVLSLTREFLRRGHTPVVVHNDPAAADTREFTCRRILDFDVYEGKNEAAKIAETMAFLEKENPDVVHVQSNTNFPLEREIRKSFPAVKSIHVYDFCPSGTKYHHRLRKECTHATGAMCLPRMIYKRCTESLRPSTLGMFYRRTMDSNRNDREYSKVIVASEYVKDQAVRSGYDPGQVDIVPYFTEAHHLGVSVKEPRIIMATGRAVPEKGLDRLLFAVKEILHVPGWKLVMDTDGPSLPALKRLAGKLGLKEKVEFPGWLNPVAHEDLYRKSSLVVVPSVWPEPFGLVGIEAMSFGKPVIAFRVGGIPDWLENGKNGFLIEPYDTKQMAEKISFLLQQPEKAAQFGVAGREAAAHKFNSELHIKRLLNIYGQLAENFSKRPQFKGA